MVQGELAEGEDGRPRASRFRPGPEQHLLQRRGRRHPRHSRGALGQVRLRRDGARFRRLGRSSRGPLLRNGVHDADRSLRGGVRSPGSGQRLSDPGAEHGVHVPRQRSLVARRAVHLPQPRRRDRPHRLADPAGARDPLRQGSRSSPPRRAHPLPRPPRRRQARSRHGRAGPARTRTHEAAPRSGLRGERRRSPRVRHLRFGGDGPLRLVGLRHRHQCGGVDRRGRGADPAGARPGVEGQCDRPFEPRPCGGA